MSKLYKGLLDIYVTKEAFPNSQWQISNTIKIIVDHKFQKASLHYKERKWEAWFALYIPINNGPYVFSALTVLIISISDTSRSYSFDLACLIKMRKTFILSITFSKSSYSFF